MAAILRSDFELPEFGEILPPKSSAIGAPPLNHPKTAAQRAAVRAELKAANARVKKFQDDQSHKRMLDRPGFNERRVQRLVARWYGSRPQLMPTVLVDPRYWQARACGWEALSTRLDDGTPAGPVHDWYYDWWLQLRPTQRDAMAREFRLSGIRPRRPRSK